MAALAALNRTCYPKMERKGIFDLEKRTVIISAFAVFACFLVLSLMKSKAFAMDETVFHYPNVLNFYNNGLGATFDQKYSAANTPLPYIIVAAFSKVFGPGIVLARIITAIFSFFTFLMGCKILERLQVAPVYSLILLFYPYFFLNSFVFYVINFGLFFCLWALWLLSAPEKKYLSVFGAGICLSLAVLCQQFYLMVLAGVLLTNPLEWISNPKAPGSFRYLFISSVLLLLPALVPLAIFIKWGGLVHPNFNMHKLAFFPTDVTGLFLVIGFYFFPYVFQNFTKADSWKAVIALLIAAVLSIKYRPVYNDINGPNIFNGIVYHITEIISKKIHLLGTVLIIALSATGMMTLIKLLETRKSGFENMVFSGSCLLALSYVLNAIFGERHMLALLFLLYFLVLPRLSGNIKKLYLPLMMLLGTGYYVYWLFFKYD